METKNLFKSGCIPWNKGKRRKLNLKEIEKEHKEGKSIIDISKKIGISDRLIRFRLKEAGLFIRKQNQWTNEAREKLRKANLGKKVSVDSRLKMSTNASCPWKGKTLPLYMRQKISLTKSGDKKFITFKNNLVKRLRINKKYLEWRSVIFKRDNYHCQNCGEKGYIEAHHIIPISFLIDKFKIKDIDDAIKCKELWDIGNGISYCRECHILLDKNLGKNLGLIKMRLNS